MGKKVIDKELKFVFLIILIYIAACIETDIYLPALADMMNYFKVSAEEIQGLLSWNFVGICLSGPIYGPLSDSFGRKKPLLVALGLFLVGSLITLAVDEFSMMLAGRFLQGVGSGGCFTLGTTILFDRFSGEKATQAIAKINSIIPFVMAAAPVVGGVLNEHFGFRSNFLAIVVMVFLSLSITVLFFPETLPAEKRTDFELRRIILNFKKVAISVPFWQTCCIVSTIFAGYMTFLSGISVLFVVELGVSKELLPLFQAALLGAWVVANFFCSRLVGKWGAKRVKNCGKAIFFSGGSLLVLALVLAPENPYALTGCMMLYSFGANWVQGVYFPESMELFPEMRGITASILSSMRLFTTAALVALTAKFYNGAIYPIGLAVVAVVLGNVTAIWFYERGRQAQASVTAAP